MIVNDTHRIAFVHIPKCAGSTVRLALSPYDQASARFYDKAVGAHPVYGRLDHHHIPLAVLQDAFPEDFERVKSYRAFALVRDPFARFPSSLHQRFVHRNGVPLSDLSAEEAAREVDAVITALARLPRDVPVTDPDLIHFSRQCDYVFLHGQQIVDAPRVVADVDAMMSEISSIIGTEIPIAQAKNNRYSYAVPGLGRLQYAVTRRIEAIVPRRIWEPAYVPIKKALKASRLIRPGGDRLSALPNADGIEAFIREFYADDVALFQRLSRERPDSAQTADAPPEPARSPRSV